MSGPGTSAILAILSRVATQINALDLLALDLDEPRNRTHDKYLSRRGAHNTVPEADRRNVLQGLHTIAGVAQYLKRIVEEQKRLPKVVVLCGAGMSTNAGIKDFRSQSGLYSDKRIKQVFNAEFLHNSPEQFYEILSTEFAPLVTRALVPTLSHAFLSVLEQKEWLLRVYTQNVDGLEHAAGVSNDRIVECHGSISRLVCNTCHTVVGDADDVSRFWTAVGSSGGVPLKCTRDNCSGGVLRPDIVLFGEPLPAQFHQLSFPDVSACDLLLVMGTSLVVYPVASLPSYVQATAVRMLINKEPTGCFQNVPPLGGADGGANVDANAGAGADVGVGAHYRDIFYQGDCDAGISELAVALGMMDILQSTHQRTSTAKSLAAE